MGVVGVAAGLVAVGLQAAPLLGSVGPKEEKGGFRFYASTRISPMSSKQSRAQPLIR